MKKLLAILLAICMLATVLCVPVLAADEPANESTNEPAPGVKLRIRVQDDGTITTIENGDYTVFEDGWNAAMKLANDHSHDRVVVDIYEDWTATLGNFTDDGALEKNGPGFNNDTIYFNDDVRMTLNMNGHTIDRGLSAYIRNGEVMYIDTDADVIINNGTITGGHSDNGAGGIHIKENAKVTLNDVHVDGNTVTGDQGAAIAVLDGATLVMKDGSISNNMLERGLFGTLSNGSIYAENATVSLSEVTFSNNQTDYSDNEGVAVYATRSTVTINDCTFADNAVSSDEAKYSLSVIFASDSALTVSNCNFEDNASKPTSAYDASVLFRLTDGRLSMDGGTITGSNSTTLFSINESAVTIKGVTITDNTSAVIYVYNNGKKVNMTECTLSNNTEEDDTIDIRVMTSGTLVMTDCTFDKDTTFLDKNMVTFSDKAAGSIFGAGSLTMIVAILALITSIAAIYMAAIYNKNKAVTEAANNAAETKNEE